MTELDALKYDLEQGRKAFDKLHERYIELLKQQSELEEENEELKKLIINKNEIQLKTLEELQKTQKELITIKNTIKDMYDNERTHLGHNVLAQLMEAIQ